MYRLYAIIVALTIKNCNAAVIHLEDMKFNVNGAPSVSQTNNLSATNTPESVKVYIIEDKQDNTKHEETEPNKNVTAVTNSPIVIKIPKTDTKSIETPKPHKEDALVKKVKPQNKDDTTKPQFKITVLKPSAQELSSNDLETRRMSKFNVYVPISEDINPYNEVLFGKGVGRRGLSLIDLKGNILRIPL